MKAPTLNRKTFAMPYGILATIFIVIPLLMLLYFAFVGENGRFTLQNFASFFTADIVKVLLRSFGIALLTTVICLILAYPLAMILANSRFNKSAILVLMFIMPMWINTLLRMYAIKNLFIDLLGVNTGFGVVIVGMVYDFFPFMLLPLYTIFVNMDKSYIEASYDLGASPLNTFFRTTLPLSLPGILSGILMVFMPTVSTFAISDILGNPETYMFGNIIDYWFTKNHWNIGSAYAFILLALIGITMLIANKLSGGKAKATGGGLL